METLVLKTILCSGVFLGFYYLFLAKEKTFVFNRFYLLSSLLFSILIPFLIIETPQLMEEKQNLIVGQDVSQQIVVSQIEEEKGFDYFQIAIIGYCIISVFFLMKFILSVSKIRNLKGQKIIHNSRKVILLKENLAPFSFWNTVYVSEQSFLNSEIEPAVFLHEEIHIRQKHSLDLIFIELLKAILWINPFFYLYKNAMINNHEFLADEEVLSHKTNIKHYQELILNEVLKQQNSALIHQFNFNDTKKRFIMMTKQNSKFAKAKKFLAIPLFAVAAFVFAEKVYGKGNENRILTPKVLSNSKDESIKVLNDSDVKIPKILIKKLQNDTISPKNNKEAKVSQPQKEKITKTVVEDFSETKTNQKTNTFPADFPGGIHDLRVKIAENFDSSIFDKKTGIISSSIFIYVDENGKTTDVKADGEDVAFNTEAVRTVKLATNNKVWTPASENGKSVKSVYKIPLKMKFEAPAPQK